MTASYRRREQRVFWEAGVLEQLPHGPAPLESVGSRTRALLRRLADALSDDDLSAQVTAGQVLEQSIRALPREGGRP
jgi:hypothetical protein